MEKKTIKWLWEKSRKSRIILAVLPIVSFIMSICYLLITMIFKGFMDIAAGDSARTFLEMVLFSAGSIVLYALTQIISSVLNGYAYSKIEKGLRVSLIKQVIHKKLLAVHKLHTGEILNRLTTDTANIANFYIQFFGQMCLVVFTSLFAVIYLFILNWKMAILFLIVIPLLTFLISVFAPKLQSAAEADLKNEDNNRVYMQEVLSRLALFQIYSMEQVIDTDINTLYEKKKASKIRQSFLEGSFGFLNSLMMFSIFIISSGVGAYFVLRGENQIGDLVAMIQLSNYIMLPLTEAPKWVAVYNGTVASVKRIQEIEEMEDLETAEIPGDVSGKIDSILLQELYFSYDGQEQILNSVNAVFKEGEVTGIIGESGSGKTTLLNLILGLYHADKDDMIQVSRNGRREPFHGGRENITYVPSENFVFRGTIKENICMSLPYENEKFHNVCTLANIDKLIQGFEKKEGESIEENGSNLSMGQKQRIAIARALYGNTPVIVFDEPTANLDPESVSVFKEMIKKIAKEKVCIIVTHDMEVAAVCDKVYKLKEKKLQKL